VWDTHSHYEDSKQAYQKLMAMASWDEFKTFIKVEAVLTNVDSSKVALIMNLLLRQLKYPEHYSWTVSILKVLFPTSTRNAKIIERGDVALLKGLFMKMGDTKLYKATPKPKPKAKAKPNAEPKEPKKGPAKGPGKGPSKGRQGQVR